ncbi:CheR family methyltransferase [Chitinimonas lacunae]|uniref:Chemotaxis protein methyltransferase n=1 Tax=Chitinimonas lacunae TaxID=1963018 RepID=A0ABV8MLK8_9NEIS
MNALLQRPTLSEHEFGRLRELIRREAAIHLPAHMKQSVSCRLEQRLRRLALRGFAEYFDYISHNQNVAELQRAVDLLTTHETYFFREPEQFDYLTRSLLPQLGSGSLRFWSAAASSGEEAYSIAMVLMANLGAGNRWEVLGSDISAEVLEKAREGVYRHERLELIPIPYLHRFCLRGVGRAAGSVQIDQTLRQRVRFCRMNLASLPAGLEPFDVIFLRNVLFYFDASTRQRVLAGVVSRLKPGGWLLLGHAECLNAASFGLRRQCPGVYRQVGEAS